MRASPTVLVAVAIGGAVGSLLRFLLAGWLAERSGGNFPWGTFAVNLSGAFLLGFFYTLALERDFDPVLRTGLATGLLGAYTTYSTLNLEAWTLLSAGAWSAGLLYLAGSWVLGLLAILVGVAAARSLAFGTFLAMAGAGLAFLTDRAGAARRGARSGSEAGREPAGQEEGSVPAGGD